LTLALSVLTRLKCRLGNKVMSIFPFFALSQLT
jgi:hypothetical protein